MEEYIPELLIECLIDYLNTLYKIPSQVHHRNDTTNSCNNNNNNTITTTQYFWVHYVYINIDTDPVIIILTYSGFCSTGISPRTCGTGEQ